MINNVSPANCEDPLDLYCSGVDSKLQKLNKKPFTPLMLSNHKLPQISKHSKKMYDCDTT